MLPLTQINWYVLRRNVQNKLIAVAKKTNKKHCAPQKRLNNINKFVTSGPRLSRISLDVAKLCNLSSLFDKHKRIILYFSFCIWSSQNKILYKHLATKCRICYLLQFTSIFFKKKKNRCCLTFDKYLFGVAIQFGFSLSRKSRTVIENRKI